MGAAFFIGILDALAHLKDVLRGLLLHDAHTEDVLYDIACAAVEDGEFRAVHLHQAVVDAQCIQGRETMLDGADVLASVAEDSAAARIDHMVGQRGDEG